MSSGRRNLTKRRVRIVLFKWLGASNALKIRFLQRYQIRNRNANLARQNLLSAWAGIEFILDLGFGEVVELVKILCNAEISRLASKIHLIINLLEVVS